MASDTEPDICCICEGERDEEAIADDIKMWEDPETYSPACSGCYEEQQEETAKAMAYWMPRRTTGDHHADR